ncbi:MAG: chorismate mutase [Desulfovermiculus sp.]|nr:chorismate mutase [Desulfovermiculus sp.]
MQLVWSGRKMKRGQKDNRPASFKLDSIDRKLVNLLAERSMILAQTARDRKGKDRSFVDPEKEKRLWGIWRQGVEEHGLNERLLRRMFHLVNSLAYEQAERREDWVMALRPRLEPVDIELPGPLDTLSSRMWLILAAALGQEMRVPDAVLNDDLIELIKACNQAGANMSWDQEGANSGASTLEFDHTSIFAGQDALNFYLLLCGAMSAPGVCRFNGGTRLKSESVGFVSSVLSAFGARQVSLVPGSEGVPIRLEASGQIPQGVQIPENAPRELVLALLLWAPLWARTKGEFRLEMPTGPSAAWGTEKIFPVWSQIGVNWRMDGRDLILQGGELTVPETPQVDLDPFLAGYVLALPAFQGGRVYLHGNYPQVGSEGEIFKHICNQAGLELNFPEGGVQSVCSRGRAQNLNLDCYLAPSFVPMALALAVSAGGESVLCLDSGQDMDFAAHILSGLNMESEQRTAKELRIRPARGRQQEPLAVTAPSASWSLGLALTALTGSKLSLKNPGVLTALWPQFWSLYKELPRPRVKTAVSEIPKEESDNGQKRRRRIVE